MVLIANWGMIISGTALWGLLTGLWPPGIPSFFFAIGGWVMYTQTLYRILLNRISVLWLTNRTKYFTILNHGMTVLIGLLNIYVAWIWSMARLYPDSGYTPINNFGKPTEKMISACIDLGLSITFIVTLKRYIDQGQLTYLANVVPIAAFCLVFSVAFDFLMFALLVANPESIYYTVGFIIGFPIKLLLELHLTNVVAEACSSGKQQATTNYSSNMAQSQK
jgi:hypothetical protein